MSEQLEIDGVEYTGINSNLRKIRRTILAIIMSIPLVLVLASTISMFFISEITVMWAIIFSTSTVLIVIFSIWFWWLIGQQVDNFKYARTENDLVIKKGVLFRKVVVIPYGRLQFVDVEQGPLLRKYKLASVTLHTASVESVTPIVGVEIQKAKQLRKELLELGEANLSGL